jgi:hypothetical protein
VSDAHTRNFNLCDGRQFQAAAEGAQCYRPKRFLTGKVIIDNYTLYTKYTLILQIDDGSHSQKQDTIGSNIAYLKMSASCATVREKHIRANVCEYVELDPAAAVALDDTFAAVRAILLIT